MKKVRILTDSAADFPKPFPENLTVLPLSIRFGQEEYLDGVDIDHHTFYEKLVSAPELPKTSLISPASFAAAFDAAGEAGEQVVAVLLSSKLSGTYQSAALAAEDRDNVWVVDSLNATLGEQILVKYALQLAAQGLSAAEIAETLERVRDEIHLLGTTDTLEYLRKGGRISASVAFVGGALGIKPVLAIRDGEVVMLGKARGSRNSNNYLIREMEKANGVDFSRPFVLGYTGQSDELLQRYIEDSRMLWENSTEMLPISTVGATIGTHVGPGAILLAFFANPV